MNVNSPISEIHQIATSAEVLLVRYDRLTACLTAATRERAAAE